MCDVRNGYPTSQAPDTRCGCGQQARCHPAHGVDAEPRFNPGRTAGHVLQDNRQGHGKAGHEAPSGQVVSAQEQKHRQNPDDRKHQTHDDGRYQQVVGDGLAGLPLWIAGIVRVLDALLLREVDTLGRRSEPTQQCINTERHYAEHGDFAERVEAAKVDEDDVDDVGATTFSLGSLQKESCEMPSGGGRIIIA